MTVWKNSLGCQRKLAVMMQARSTQYLHENERIEIKRSAAEGAMRISIAASEWWAVPQKAITPLNGSPFRYSMLEGAISIKRPTAIHNTPQKRISDFLLSGKMLFISKNIPESPRRGMTKRALKKRGRGSMFMRRAHAARRNSQRLRMFAGGVSGLAPRSLSTRGREKYERT